MDIQIFYYKLDQKCVKIEMFFNTLKVKSFYFYQK